MTMFTWFRHLFSDSSKPALSTEPHPDTVEKKPQGPARTRHFAADDVSLMQHYQIDFMFSGWLFEAEDHTDIFANGNENAILAALDGIVASDQAGAHLVHRMPGVIPQLLQSLRTGDFAGAELARKITHDVVLVAEVLRLANSVTYSLGKPVTSIDHAILVLGQDGLRQLVTGVAFRPIINLNSGSFTKKLAPRLWAQSERCATACRMLACDQTVDPFDAFLAGLVQNVGLTVSLRVIDKMSDGRQSIGSPAFCNALATYGHTLTDRICREWHFPDSVMSAIREQASSDEQARLSPVGRILWMGDYLSKMDLLARHGRLDTEDPKVVEGLSEKELACLRELALAEERDWISVTSANARESTGRSG